MLLSHRSTVKLAVSVYNDALTASVFPPSWQTTCLTLLPKKGDLSDLKNWRPISLINTDAKVFTCLQNARLMPSLSKVISSHQLGVMPERFIGENGLILRCAQTVAFHTSSSAIALLLDQEKDYDRVHAGYLKHVLLAFGIPSMIVSAVIRLFFFTDIFVNINVNITTPRFKARRPLSPLLFNLAFDPLLQLIQGDALFTGFDLHDDLHSASFSVPLPDLDPDSAITHLSASLNDMSISASVHRVVYPSPSPSASFTSPIKAIAYTDDVLVFLKSSSDFLRFRDLFNIYAGASNDNLNITKTDMLSFPGLPIPSWQFFLADHSIIH